MSEKILRPFAENIWIADGPAVIFLGFPYSVRMTIIRLADGTLFVHSPISPTPEMMKEVDELGKVMFLVSPNKIHHLYLGDWKKIYPQAKMYASPGLAKRRKDLSFDAKLTNDTPVEWAGQIDQLIFAGSMAMSEVVFFHHRSKTLILADLIENFDPTWFKGWQAWAAEKIVGIVAPNGKAPFDFRLSFLGRKSKARLCLAKMKAWEPKHIIIAHGHCFKNNGKAELARAFAWLD